MEPCVWLLCKARQQQYPASAHRCLGGANGPSRRTMMAESTASSCVTSCRLAPVTMSDNGTPRSSTSRWRLLPFFPPIGRIRPDRFWCQRRLEHGPVDAFPGPRNALHLAVLGKTRLPERLEHTGRLPFEKSLVDRAGTAKTLLGQRPPLAARAQYIHDGLKHQPRRLGGPSRAGLGHIRLVTRTLASWNQRFDTLPEIVRHNPCINTLANHQPRRDVAQTATQNVSLLFAGKFYVEPDPLSRNSPQCPTLGACGRCLVRRDALRALASGRQAAHGARAGRAVLGQPHGRERGRVAHEVGGPGGIAPRQRRVRAGGDDSTAEF